MQQISSNYKNEIKQPSRHFECRVTIGKNIYTNESIVDIILDYPQAIDGFSIGNTTSQSLDLTLLNTGEEIYSTNQIKVEIGLQVGSAFEYILMGYYNVDEVSKNDYTIKFTAFDNMMKFETPYFSSLGDKPTLQQVVNELATITGISFVGSIPSYTVTKLDGYTCREVLSYVASLCGGNALITRDGKFTIKTLQVVDCSVTTETHFGLTTEEVPYKLGKITCVVDSEIELSKGATGIDSMELSFENPWMTESILNTLYQQLNGFSYLGFQTKWQGDLALDPYDLILIQDKKGTSHRVPILNQKFTYVGGLTSEIAAKGESKNKNSFSSSGPNANKTNRIVTEQAIIKEALINKANIQDLEAVSIRTQSLEATTAKIQDAIIDVAHISDLNAVNAKIESLQATDVTIQNAIINKADISELNAAVANINILNADLGVIKHLVNGNLSSENIQAGGITSDKLTIANGFIKDAMIDSLNANKITAGQINTALVQVSSASGNLVINDNTIQIRDVNRVRVQIGKDASNDYSMSVWDSSGQLMFDARGLKANAIKDSIIRNDMISTDANIDGSKLNISSVVSSINNSSSTLKASKVQFDGIAQTLEVAFNALKTQADGTKTQTESNTTAINVAQGQIKTLIQDTTITTSIGSTKLKDAYSKLEQTVGSLSSTIGSQQTIIDDHTGKITSTNSELSTLKQSVNGLSASVSSAQTTINSHTTLINQKADLTAVNDKINSAKNELNTAIGKKANATDVYTKSEVYTKSQTDSAIDIAKDAINLGVSQTYETKANVESKINGIQIGGRNLAQQSHRFNKGDGATGITSMSNSDGSISVTASSGNGNWFANFIVTSAGIEDSFNEGDTFTISFIASSENTTKIPIIYIKSGIGYYPMKGTLGPKDSVIYYTGIWKKANIISIHLGFSGIVGTINFKKWKLEKGNKATDWSPAPEDVTADIATAKTEAINSANSTLTTTIANYYTKSQTDSQINVAKNAITQSVASTYETKSDVTSKINGVNSSISNLQSRMSSAESKITDTAITNTVKQNFYTKTETENAITSKNYATQSQVQQTAENIEFKFTQSGGYNLIRNGGFENGITHWSLNGSPSITENQVWQNYNGKSIFISSPAAGNGIYQFFPTTPGVTYSYSFYAQAEYGEWFGGVENRHTQNIAVSPNNWRRYTGTFTATATSHAFICYSHGGDRNVFIDNVMICEGQLPSAYTPHPSEVYDGITTIDKDGIKVSASNINGYTHMTNWGFFVNKGGKDVVSIDNRGLRLFDAKIQLTHANGNKYFLLDENGIVMYNPANGTHQWGKVAAINNKFTVASNGNSSGLSLGHHVNDNYVEDILCDSNGVVSVQRQMNHNGVFYNNYGQMFIRQPGQGGWEITGRSDSQSIKPGGANQGAIGSNNQYINQSWIANRQNPSSLEYKHLSHYVDDLECLKLVNEVQPARYFYKEYDEEGNDITTFTTRTSQLGLIYEDVRECEGRDLITNEEDKAINLYNMVSTLWGAVRNLNQRLNELEIENLKLNNKLDQIKATQKEVI